MLLVCCCRCYKESTTTHSIVTGKGGTAPAPLPSSTRTLSMAIVLKPHTPFPHTKATLWKENAQNPPP